MLRFDNIKLPKIPGKIPGIAADFKKNRARARNRYFALWGGRVRSPIGPATCVVYDLVVAEPRALA